MIRQTRSTFVDPEPLSVITILGVAIALALPLLKTIEVHFGGWAATFSAAAMVAFPALLIASVAWSGRRRAVRESDRSTKKEGP